MHMIAFHQYVGISHLHFETILAVGIFLVVYGLGEGRVRLRPRRGDIEVEVLTVRDSYRLSTGHHRGPFSRLLIFHEKCVEEACAPTLFVKGFAKEAGADGSLRSCPGSSIMRSHSGPLHHPDYAGETTMTSHDKGDAKRVACTYPGCENGARAGQRVPFSDTRPGARARDVVFISYMWTLAERVGDAAVAAALCFVHKHDSCVPFPVPAAPPTQGFRPSTDPRFQATPLSRPRSAPPSVQPASRPTAPPRAEARPSGRPQNAPRPAASRVERPQAPPRESARVQRPVAPAARTQQQAIRPAAPHAEAPVARPVARPAAPAARPVASLQRSAPRSDRSRTTFGDLGFNPDVFGEAWKAHKAKKAAERGVLVSAAPAVVETKAASEPVALESEPDTAPAETSESVVQDGPIIASHRRSPKVSVMVETGPVTGHGVEGHYFRRNASPESVLEQDLSTAVGEMPEPPLVRKIELRGEELWLVTWCAGILIDELAMFKAIDEHGCSTWGYRDAKADTYLMRLPDRDLGLCTCEHVGCGRTAIRVLTFVRRFGWAPRRLPKQPDYKLAIELELRA